MLDELGYLPFARSGGQLRFQLISKLYERTLAICANRLQPRERLGVKPAAVTVARKLAVITHTMLITGAARLRMRSG